MFFESYPVKSDYELDEIFKDLIQTWFTLLSFTVFSGDIKKKALEMISQLAFLFVPQP